MTAASLGASLMFLGGDAAARPSGQYVDCVRQPGNETSVTVDASRQSGFDIGDMQTNADGKPLRWRADHFRVEAGGLAVQLTWKDRGAQYGMIVDYASVMTHEVTGTNPATGNQIGVSATPFVEDAGKMKLTFSCNPPVTA